MSTALNAPIPSFDALTATSGTTVSSETLKGQFSVLYFYPKDSTPGCTTESQDFTRLFDEFQALNCQIFGVSRETCQKQEVKTKIDSKNVKIILLSNSKKKDNHASKNEEGQE